MTVKSGNFVRFTTRELAERRARKGLKSDLARVAATSQDDLERDIASNPDWTDVPADWWKDARLAVPASKRLLSVRLDPDIVEWFRSQGPGYQTRMNAVLPAYVEQKRKA